MNSHYKSSDIRHTVAAIACAIVLGSTFLIGAVAPAHVVAPAAVSTQVAA